MENTTEYSNNCDNLLIAYNDYISYEILEGEIINYAE